MTTYVIITDKEIPLEEFRDVLMDNFAAGQIAKLDGADGFNIDNVATP